MPEVVVGLKEALALLDDAPLNIALLGFGRAGRAAINVVAAGLASRTPIGVGPTRGDLLKALKVESTVDTAGKGVVAKTGFSGEQGQIAFYVEYGHVERGHRPARKVVGRVPPHPFMRPAFDATADEAITVFADTLSAELKKTYG